MNCVFIVDFQYESVNYSSVEEKRFRTYIWSRMSVKSFLGIWIKGMVAKAYIFDAF